MKKVFWQDLDQSQNDKSTVQSKNTWIKQIQQHQMLAWIYAIQAQILGTADLSVGRYSRFIREDHPQSKSRWATYGYWIGRI